MQRRIMHLDIDAFFASVEQVRNPNLAGKPVIVGAGVIASCSYQARKFGLRAGMSLGTARQLCPDAVILAGSHHVYNAFARKVWDICLDFTPAIETLLDDAYLDFTGTDRLYGEFRTMMRRLKQCIRRQTGLAATVGLATSRTVARMATASGKPDGLVVIEPGREMDFIRDLPVEKLPGVGHVTAEALGRLNVGTVGELARLGRLTLETMFGANGTALFERAHGRDSQVVHRREIPQSISRETTFHHDTGDRGEIEGMLYYLIERAMRTLRELGLVTRTVTVKIRYSDFEGETTAYTLPQFTDLDGEVFEAAHPMLRRMYRRRVNLRQVGVKLSGFAIGGNQRQLDLFGRKGRQRPIGLYRAMDEVRDRFGYGAILAGRSLELLDRLAHDDYGFVLRTPSLTK